MRSTEIINVKNCKRNIFICNTPYQILVSISIIEKFFSSDENIFLCSTIMNNAKEVVKNLSKYYQTFLIDYKKKNKKRIERVLNRIFYKATYKKYNLDDEILKSYDNVFFSNMSNDHYVIIKKLKDINSKISINMFEDGASTYSKHYEIGLFYNKVKWYKLIQKIYAFKPKEIEWRDRSNMLFVEIPPINCEDDKYIEKVNNIFNYSEIDDYKKYKYIFFEEGFHADGNEVCDIELLEFIASIVGKEKVFVKTHPRSKDNRFLEKGFSTNLNSSIPWEVICLNLDLSKKVLLTLSSQSTFTPMFLLNKKTTSIIMFNLVEDKSKILIDPAQFLERKGSSLENFYSIHSKEELMQILEKIEKGVTHEN